MTKAQGFQRYARLAKMADCIANEKDVYSQYLGVACNVLSIFSVAQSTGTTPAVMPDPLEVCETMSDMLPAPSAVFTED